MPPPAHPHKSKIINGGFGPQQSRGSKMNISEIKDIAGRFDINNAEANRIAKTVDTEIDFILVWELEDWWTDKMAIQPQCLNDKGQQHIKNELISLSLDWDAAAVMTEVEEKMLSFSEMFEPNNDSFRYEISKNSASRQGVCQSGYGVFAEIEITSDMVHFEDTTQ